MLINSSKTPQNYEIDQNPILWYIQEYKLIIYNAINFIVSQYKSFFLSLNNYRTLSRPVRPTCVKSLSLEKWQLQQKQNYTNCYLKA